MGKTIAQKIIASHLVSGDMTPGSEVALRIDQTLTQDATGTMAYLEFETMGIPRVKTEMSIAYVDHNTLQCGFENSDDHRYLQTVTAKHGVYFSRPGNGICHQVHLERFGKPGKTLIGSDSHTPTGGGIGMLAFGAGGLDVAVAMGGGAYYITMPKMYKVNLTGRLRPYVTAKDVSLELLRILSVKGGVGAIIEWGGEGIATLSVPERGTITNMGTELGATTSIFPSDEVTRKFLAAQGREEDYVPLSSDPDAEYDKIIDIDLGTLKPMIACPHSPDNVVAVETLKDVKVDQVCIGSCTNSSLYDMLKVAAMLKGKTIHPSVSLSVSPGSRQVLTMLSDTLYYGISHNAAKRFTPFEMTYVMFIVGMVVFIPVGLIYAGGLHSPLITGPMHDGGFWVAVLYLGLLSSVLAYGLLNFANSHLSVSETSLFSNVTTVVSVLAGVVLLKEPFSVWQMLGVVIILVCVFVANVSGKETKSHSQEV